MGATSSAQLKSFPHGVHPPDHKEDAAAKGMLRLPFPPTLILPLSQHIGAPAKVLVRAGQEVVRGEPIAAAGGFVSAPIHAPMTGVIDKVDLALLANGSMGPAIFLSPYPGSSQEVLYGAPVDVETLTPAQLVKAVQDAGLVGLGGAAFPTHVKLAVPEGKSIDTVIANGCECEPYLTTDHRLMLERAGDLFAGIRIALRATGAKEAIIGVEANKPDAIAALTAALPASMPIRVAAVKTKYPQGAEKMLIKALLKREVPSGGLPSDVNVAVFNVGTLAQMGYLLPRGEGLIERGVTITGPGVARPGNYLIPIGTPVRFALDYVGFAGAPRQVILGGPMMGPSMGSLDVPITKGVSGILVFTEAELAQRPKTVYACIRCGQCLQACPVFLNPSRLGLLARKGAYQTMEEKYHLNDCFECGSCSFTCPSNIPLVQYFRMAKTRNRERKAKK